MKLLKIKSIKKIKSFSKKYDIETKYTHNFFANNILVHNSSMSCILLKDEFNVCSHNLNLKEFDENLGARTTELKNTFWKVAREQDIEQKIRFYCDKRNIKEIGIQGELLGEGIQKNKYKLKGHDVYLFNVFNIDTQKYFDWEEFQDLISLTGLKQAPIVFETFKLDNLKIDDLLKIVEGQSILNNQTQREGIVFKTKNKLDKSIYFHSFGKISFKVINNKFLLKYNDE